MFRGRSSYCYLGVFEVPPRTPHGVECNLQVRHEYANNNIYFG